MNILNLGVPFFCDMTPLRRYRGAHDIRTIGVGDGADYRFDPGGDGIADALGRMEGWAPDLILCWAPDLYPPPRDIEESPVKTAALVSDWNINFPRLYVNLARFDVVLCDKPGARALALNGIEPRHVFPLYSQDSAVHRLYDDGKDFDVVFVGNLNPAAHWRRAGYLERLAALGERYRIKLAMGYVGEDYGRLLSRARIVFNHSIRGEVNLRVFETFACGSLALIEEDNLEARDWFEDGREVVFYNGENFEERIAYYLEHEDERQAVARRGLEQAERWAGENRWDELIEAVEKIPCGGRPFQRLPERDQLLHTALMFRDARVPGYHAAAKEILERMTRDYPDDADVWTAQGRSVLAEPRFAHDSHERAATAIEAFEQAHACAPDSAPYALNLALVLESAGLLEAEADALDAVMRARSLRGGTHLFGQHDDPFWLDWLRALAEGQASLPMLQAEALIRRCINAERRGMAAEALPLLERALALNPANVNAVMPRSRLLWELGRRDEACDYLLTNIKRLPLDLPARAALAQMLIETGRFRDAKAVVDASMRLARTLDLRETPAE